MKKLLFTGLFAFLAVSVTLAQQPPSGREKQQYHKQHHKHHRHYRHHRGLALSKQLNFSDAQKQQLKTIGQDFHQKMVALNKNENITVKAMRDQRAALVKDQQTAFQNILTPEQKTKLSDLKKQHAAKRQEMASKRMDKMKEKLSLTEDQTAKIKSLNDQFREKIMQTKDNTTMDRSAKKEAFSAMMKQRKEDMRGILTPEQQTKLEEWKKDKMGRL